MEGFNFFTVLHRGCYGGGGIHRIPKEIINIYESEVGYKWKSDRLDQKMGKLIDKYQNEYESITEVVFIDIKFWDCWDINEYDGFENIQINKDKYKLKLIKEAIKMKQNNQASNEEIVYLSNNELNEIMNMEITDGYVHESLEELVKYKSDQII